MMKKNTRLLSLLLAAVLSMGLAACSDDTEKEPEANNSETVQEEPAEAPKEETQEPQEEAEKKPEAEASQEGDREMRCELEGTPLEQAEFLTAEQQEVILKATQYLPAFQVNAGYFPEDPIPNNAPEPEMRTIDGQQYISYTGERYSNWSNFWTDMHSAFTDEFFDELNKVEFPDATYAKYINPDDTQDGQLFYMGGGRGSDMSYLGNDRWELVEKTEDTIQLNWIAYYASDEDMNNMNPAIDEWSTLPLDHSERFPVVLKNTEAGWRVDSMTLPY